MTDASKTKPARTDERGWRPSSPTWVRRRSTAASAEVDPQARRGPVRYGDRYPHKAARYAQGTGEITPPRIVLAQPASDGTIGFSNWQMVNTSRPSTYPEEAQYDLCVVAGRLRTDRSFCSTAQQDSTAISAPPRSSVRVWLAAREIGHPPTNVVMMAWVSRWPNFDNVVPAMDLMQEDLAYADLKGASRG